MSFLADRGEVVIGRTDIDSYAVFPEDGAALVRELQAGRMDIQVLSLKYEDLLNDFENQRTRMYRFLELDPALCRFPYSSLP